jgi:starch synthase
MIAVPSRFESCGLTQMYGLRHGTVPIVRRVGGLADTVHDAGAGGTDGVIQPNGFVFDAATALDLQAAITRAIDCCHQTQHWAELMRRGMQLDHSWSGPAAQYMALYEKTWVGRSA